MGTEAGGNPFERRKGHKVERWENFYSHSQEQLFLSVYVDNVKMVGRTESVAPMWRKLRKHIDLEDSSLELHQLYLGCTHSVADNGEWVITDTSDFFRRITTSHVDDNQKTKSP